MSKLVDEHAHDADDDEPAVRGIPAAEDGNPNEYGCHRAERVPERISDVEIVDPMTVDEWPVVRPADLRHREREYPDEKVHQASAGRSVVQAVAPREELQRRTGLAGAQHHGANTDPY